jgi:hypothetical protein
MGRKKRPKRPTQASTKPTKAASPPKKPFWRNPVTWLGSVCTLVLTGVLVNVLTTQAQRIAPPDVSAPSSSMHLTASPGASTSSNSPEPLPTPFSRAQSSGCPKSSGSVPFVDSVYHETSLDIQGQRVVLPQKVNLSENDLASLYKEGTGWLSERGAYDGGSAHIELTLTGCQYVRILSMRAVILSRAKPLTGTLFNSAAQGATADVPLYFNLDAASPVASVQDSTGRLQPYFANQTFSLSPNEQDTFAINAYADKWAVTWNLDIVYLYEGRTVNKVIDDNGQPFRVTAVYNSPGKYESSYHQCLGESYDSQPGCSNISQMIWVKD